MKVTDWVNWGNTSYESCPFNLQEDAKRVIIEEIRNKGYKICGYTHQNPNIEKYAGIPVLDNKYKFETSLEGWGRIMAEALGFEDIDANWRDWGLNSLDPEVLPKA